MYLCIYVANHTQVLTEKTSMKLKVCVGLLIPREISHLVKCIIPSHFAMVFISFPKMPPIRYPYNDSSQLICLCY